jgi:SAM-dependent methyltransferase
MSDAPGVRDARCVVCAGAYRFLALKQGHRLYRCAECGLVSVLPIPEPDELVRTLYSGGSGGGAAFVRPVSRSIRADYEGQLDFVSRHDPHGILLDVGCAGGDFLLAARRRGMESVGVEVNPEAVAVAKSRGLDVVCGTVADAGFTTGRFGVVRLGDVIEHVPAPSDLLRECVRVMAPNGTLIVTTPNLASPWARMTFAMHRALGVPWSAVTPPAHVHQFDVRNLPLLLREHGLEVVGWRFGPPRLRYELGAACPRSRAAEVGGVVPLLGVYGLYVLAYGLAALVGAFARPNFHMTVFCRRAGRGESGVAA